MIVANQLSLANFTYAYKARIEKVRKKIKKLVNREFIVIVRTIQYLKASV